MTSNAGPERCAKTVTLAVPTTYVVEADGDGEEIGSRALRVRPSSDDLHQTPTRRARVLAIAVSLVMLAGTVGAAQDRASTPVGAVLEAEDLGISLARIQRKLDRLPDREEARSLLRLNYYVQVYARAPRLDLFRGFDLHNSPIPYGVPLHSEMLSVMRPNQLYPSAANLTPIVGWAWRGLKP